MRKRQSALSVFVAAVALAIAAAAVHAQPAGARSAQAAAPIDITGYWVALITDDWQYRMIVPAKGDASWIPLNAAGRAVTNAWDPVADAAAGLECKGFGAPAIMRLPTRLRISWEDDNTLLVETDLGRQIRRFHFVDSEPQGERTWQGHSVARWLIPGARRRFGAFRNDAILENEGGGSLQIDTTHLRAGYLRRNGVPFSEATFMTEFFNLLVGDAGDQYLAIQAFIEDPVYLDQHFVRTLQFRKEPNGARWNPTACAADGWATQ